MLAAFSPGKSERRIVEGQVIMMNGDPRELEARVISRHKESDEAVISNLQANLRKIYRVDDEIDTSGSSVHHVAKSVARRIHLDAYTPTDIYARLGEIADGALLEE